MTLFTHTVHWRELNSILVFDSGIINMTAENLLYFDGIIIQYTRACFGVFDKSCSLKNSVPSFWLVSWNADTLMTVSGGTLCRLFSSIFARQVRCILRASHHQLHRADSAWTCLLAWQPHDPQRFERWFCSFYIHYLSSAVQGSHVMFYYYWSNTVKCQFCDHLQVHSPPWYSTKPPRSAQPGHPSVGRCNEYWRW